MTKTYSITPPNSKTSLENVTDKQIATLVLELAGGGWASKQTAEAIRISNKIYSLTEFQKVKFKGYVFQPQPPPKAPITT